MNKHPFHGLLMKARSVLWVCVIIHRRLGLYLKNILWVLHLY